MRFKIFLRHGQSFRSQNIKTNRKYSLDGGRTKDSGVESFEFLLARISLVGRKAIVDDFVVCFSDPFI